MAGANMNGIGRVFGNEALNIIKLRVSFHIKDNRNKMAKKLGTDFEQEFKDLCNNMLLTSTVENYKIAKQYMDDFIKGKTEREFVSTWIGLIGGTREKCSFFMNFP